MKSPEFYGLLRSLESYKTSFNNKRDLLVLRPDIAYFKHFKKF